ncbi:MAG: hypothetical protein ABSE42_15630 [Bryobacteraceae bacterium]|jgi:hypothetical protein
MSRFSGKHHLVQAIRDGVGEMHRLHVRQGWYDGHDLINWMNSNRNEELNDIIDYYRPSGADPVHIATIQIGNFLKNRLGQQKITEQTSPRQITLRGGANRDGHCNVSVWQISHDTALGNCRDRTARDS